jgi:hypothetical protein
LESKGLRFGRRGAFEIEPGSAMAALVPDPVPVGLYGVDPYPERPIAPWRRRRFPETALANLEDPNIYEPPARFDRDVYFGLTPIEWSAIGAGAMVTLGAGVGLYLRARRVRPNRRRRRRARASRRTNR